MIYWETQAFPHPITNEPGQGRLSISRAPVENYQSTLKGTTPPSVDIAVHMASYQHQDFGVPEQGTEELQGAQLCDQSKHLRGPALESGRGRVRSIDGNYRVITLFSLW